MKLLFSTIRDGITSILALALLALVGPTLFDKPSSEPGPTQVADSLSQMDAYPQPVVTDQGQVAPVVRTALLRLPASDDPSTVTSSPPEPTDAPIISPRRGTPPPPGHTLICDHDGCHEVCTTPHPIYSQEDGGSYVSPHMRPRYTRCPTCSPSRAQLLWARRLPNYDRLRQDYTDQQIIQYFGSDRLQHLAGDYLPPELDPQRGVGSEDNIQR